jgi:glycosyltransferase involved in cell wall biosynthesis
VAIEIPMKLVVALPALNEEATIYDVIERIPKKIEGVEEIRVLVIDDGSTDQSVKEAERAGATVVKHWTNQGVGAAFQTGVQWAIVNGLDIYCSIDSDGQFDPNDIPHLISPIVSERADFTTASRFKNPKLKPDMTRVKYFGNQVMSYLVSKLCQKRFYDVSCGMRAYSRKALLTLNLVGTFTYTQEVFLNLVFKKLRIEEVPIRVRGIREFGRSRVASNLFQYGFQTLKIIFRVYRDFRPLTMFSVIAGLLMVPGVTLGIFLISHYYQTGEFSPYKWMGFASMGLGVLGVISLHMGFIGDMLVRHRLYLEELLYYERMNLSNKS